MKTKFLTLSMIALVVITSISCSKDDVVVPAPVNTVAVNPPSSTPTPIPATGTFINATTDGLTFATIAGPQLRATRTSSGAITVIEVIGVNVTADANGSRRSISLNLNNITTAGTYTVAANNSARSVVLLYSVVNAQFVSSNYFCGDCNTTGTVRVTSVDATKIEGTFSFTGSGSSCSDLKTITAGSFRGVF